MRRCLEKNFENRPFVVEVLEHPFFTELTGDTGKDHHVTLYTKIINFLLIMYSNFSYLARLSIS